MGEEKCTGEINNTPQFQFETENGKGNIGCEVVVEVLKQCDELDLKNYNSICLPLRTVKILPSLFQFC
jgi:hypothetical protein